MSLIATITDTGIDVPTLDDCLAYLQDQYRSIYGSDVNLDPDTKDGQWLGVLAKGFSDANQALAAVFLSFSPSFAQGANFSSLVKINGLRRLIATNSQQNMDIAGTVGTTITNGAVSDANKQQWNLPASVTIPPGGTITVTATAASAGDITAVGPLTIATPTRGWSTVALNGDTAVGKPVETDAALRRRQQVSTGLPATTPLAAIVSNVSNVTGVTRVKPYENDTNAADANGIPSKNICLVVEGGDALAIATAIFQKKAPGVPTFGTTSEIVVDSLGMNHTINFFNLDIQTIKMLVNLTGLSGYVSTTGDKIIASLVQWINGLGIGSPSYHSRLYGPANLMGDAATEATGLSQTVLDGLSNTFNLTSIYQSLPNMTVTGGPFAAGTNVFDIADASNIAVGDKIGVPMDNGVILYTTVTALAGTAVTMADNIPATRQINTGAQVYVSGDLSVAFNAAAGAATADIILTAS